MASTYASVWFSFSGDEVLVIEVEAIARSNADIKRKFAFHYMEAKI
jgi:hypothetical protein